MSDPRPDKSIYVTRQEFYMSLSLIWLYIALVIGKLLDLAEGSVTTLILFGAALGMSLTFSIIVIRGMKTNKSNLSNKS